MKTIDSHWFLAIATALSHLFHLLPLQGVPASDGLDPTIVAAFIGLGGVVVGALIAGAFAVYQFRAQAKKTAQLEKQLQDNQFDHEKEMEHFRQTLAKQERNEQHDEQVEEAARVATVHVQSQQALVQSYLRALHTDPRIARLQILDMTRPLDVTDIYVRLRLHEETRPSYHLEIHSRETMPGTDPNALLKLGQKRLEQRTSTALTPEEALRKYKRCVIVGDPGAGKSTLLKYLVLRSADGHLPDLPAFPIHIELQAFATSDQRDLLAFSAAVWQERYGFPHKEALDALQTALRDGRALLLLDALDETATGATKEQADASYVQVSQKITDLATRYPQAPLVVSVRKAGYYQHVRLPGFTEVEVLDFSPDDSSQFIQRWFAVHPDTKKRNHAPDLIARLERNPRIQALAANPLLLTLIVLVYEDQFDLPERRAELYRQCVEILLTKWDTSRNIRRRRAFKPEHKRQLLEEIAWHFHQQGQRYFPEPELLECIATFLPAVGIGPEQSRQILDEIAAENGLLKEQARGWYGFLHLTLQEYFAAQYAVDHQQIDAILRKRDDPWWEEVLLLYAGRIPDASALLQRLLEGIDKDHGQQPHDLYMTDLLLAGRCLGAFPIVRQTSLRSEIIERLFVLLQTSPYSLTREQSAKTLGEIGGASVSHHLLSLLSDEQVERTVRLRIAEALGTLGDRTVVPALLALLANEQVDHWVRARIAEALGTLGDRTVVPDMLALLANEQVETWVLASIAGTLSSLIQNEAEVRSLTALLPTSDIADSIHRLLWIISRQLGLRIVVSNRPEGEHMEVIRSPTV